MHRAIPLLAAMAVFSAVGAHADLLTNGSFENSNATFVGDANHVDELNSGSTAIPGWTTINGTQTAWIQNGNPYGISASNGQYFLDLTGYRDSVTYGGVSQSFATTPGTSYVVTFDLGYGGNSGLFGGPVSVTVSAAGTSGIFTSASGTPNPALWDSETFDFTANASTTTLDIVGRSTAGGEYIGLDNVSVVPGSINPGPTPEPGSCALLLTGLGFVGAAMRRRLRCRLV